MKKYANYTCQGCKTKFHSGQLNVHHRNYDSFGNERMSDLQVLCRSCHSAADAHRVEQVAVRGEQRQSDAACHSFLSKKYGDNYSSFANDGMYEEVDRWRAKKHYGETGEDW